MTKRTFLVVALTFGLIGVCNPRAASADSTGTIFTYTYNGVSDVTTPTVNAEALGVSAPSSVLSTSVLDPISVPDPISIPDLNSVLGPTSAPEPESLSLLLIGLAGLGLLLRYRMAKRPEYSSLCKS